MKQIILFFVTVCAISCNDSATVKDGAAATSKTAETTSSATKPNYPYTIPKPDNWEIGNTSNTNTALSALKAWEDGKMDEAVKYFSDSVMVNFDGISKKMSNDSLKAFLNIGYNNSKNVKIKMSDWESVVSKDKSQEWVTLWYTQYNDTKQGGRDSIDILNDVQLKDGKIVRLDEYTRKF